MTQYRVRSIETVKLTQGLLLELKKSKSHTSLLGMFQYGKLLVQIRRPNHQQWFSISEEHGGSSSDPGAFRLAICTRAALTLDTDNLLFISLLSAYDRAGKERDWVSISF